MGKVVQLRRDMPHISAAPPVDVAPPAEPLPQPLPRRLALHDLPWGIRYVLYLATCFVLLVLAERFLG